MAPEPPKSVVLPSSGSNATMMKETSNIHIPGKWMYRVDEKLVLQCPAGYLGPPYYLVGRFIRILSSHFSPSVSVYFFPRFLLLYFSPFLDCDPGSWGQACAKTCLCSDNLPCDFKSGYCSNHACLRGYTGDNCQQGISPLREDNRAVSACLFH